MYDQRKIFFKFKETKAMTKEFLMGFTGIKGLSSHGFFVGDEFVYTQFHE